MALLSIAVKIKQVEAEGEGAAEFCPLNSCGSHAQRSYATTCWILRGVEANQDGVERILGRAGTKCHAAAGWTPVLVNAHGQR